MVYWLESVKGREHVEDLGVDEIMRLDLGEIWW
jgi:hypothetical protein